VDEPVILTCGISGAVADRAQCAAIPYTPEEYAAEAKRAVDEGATMIHIHARDPRTGAPSHEVEDFGAITAAIRGAVDDVIINYSTGAIGVSVEHRLTYLRALRPDVAALNMGSMNYAKWSARRREFVFATVFENSFETIIAFVREMAQLGIRPEHECFDAGHVANLIPLIDMELVGAPLQISCVMGVTGGIRRPPATSRSWPTRSPRGATTGASSRSGASSGAGGRGAHARAGTCASVSRTTSTCPTGRWPGRTASSIARARAEDVGARPATVAEARERSAARGGAVSLR
jgi:hypothetical protein